MIRDIRKHLGSLTQQISSPMKFPLAFAIVVEVLSSLQIFHITLSPTFTLNSSSQFTYSQWVQDVTVYTGTIDPTDGTISDWTVEIIWYILIAYLVLHVLAVLLMIFLEIKRKKYKLDIVFKVMGLVYILHSRLLFYVVHYFFSAIIWLYIENHDDYQDNAPYYHSQPWFTITIMGVCVNLIIGYFVEFALYNVNKSKNDYSIKSNFLHQSVLLHKTLAIILHFIFNNLGSVGIIEAIVHVLFTCSAIYIIFTKLPFYKTILLKTKIVLLALTLASSIILVIQEFNVDSIYLELSWLMLTILLIKLSLIAFNILTKSILYGKFDTPEKAIHFVILMKENNFGFISPGVHRRQFQLGTLYSTGFLMNQKVKLDSGNKEVKEYDRIAYKYMMERLSLVNNKYKKSVPLVLFMAKIYLKKLENIPYVIGLLKKINEQNLSMPLRNSVEEFTKTLERIYFDQHQKNDQDFDLISYFKYREISNSLKEQIISETKMHLDLWQELKKDKEVDVKRLIDVAYNIDKMFHQNALRFNQNLTGFSKHIANALLVYRTYAEIVREIPVEARKLMKKFINIRHNHVLRHPLDIYSDEKAILVLSLQKDTVGKIIDASGSAQTFFQLDKSKFMGQQMTSLMPSVLMKSHLQYLQTYAKNLDQKIDYQFNTYGKTSDGDLFELSAHISLYPEIDKEAKLMMLCQRLNPPSPIIIVDNDGQIVEYSKSVKEILMTEDLNIGTRLKRMAAEYDIVNTAFNMVYNPKNRGEDTEEINKKFMRKKTTKSRGSRGSQLSSSLSVKTQWVKEAFTTSTYNKEDLDPEKALDICNNFIGGGKLTFNGNSKRAEIVYDIQIEPLVTEEQLFKVVTLKYEDNARIIEPKLSAIEVDMEHSEILTDLFPEDFPSEREGKIDDYSSPQVGATLHHMASKGQSPKKGELMSRLTLGVPNTTMDREMSLMTKSTLRPSLKGLRSTEIVEKPKISLSVEEPAKALPIAREMSVTSYATGSVEAIKALRLIFDQKSTYPLRRNSMIIIGLILLSMIALTIVFYIFSRNSILEHEKNIEIINLTNQRLAAAHKSWQYAIRYLLIKAGVSTEDLSFITSSLVTSSENLLSKNFDLSRHVAESLQEDRLRDVYQDDINFWEPCQGITTNDHPLNSFVATDVLYNKFLSISEPLQSCSSINFSDNLLYVVNNTANDYIISSEKLADVTQGILSANVETSVWNLELILIFESAALAALAMYLIYAIRTLVQSYRRLFRALMKIDVIQVSNRIMQLQVALKSLEIDIEDKTFGADPVNSIQEIKPTFKEFSKGKSKRQGFIHREDTFTIKMLQRYVAKYVGGTLIFILIPAILFYVSLSKSINNFGNLDYLDTQLSLTTKAEYQGRMIMSNFYIQMVFQNESSILIRNQPPSEQLSINLDITNSLHTQMLSVFFENKDYTPDSTIQAMMQDTICSFLPTTDATVVQFCPIATEGYTIGVLSIDANFISISTTYISDYLRQPTYDKMKSLVDTYRGDVRPLMVVLEAAFNYLNAHILANAHAEIKEFNDGTAGLFVGILLSIALSIIMIYYLSINTFSEMDMGRGKILKIIPYQILKDNKNLDAYLNKDFKKKKFAIK